MIESGQEALLGDVREAYDIPEQIASEIVELSCKRYISQLLNLALRAAKRYKEEEAVEWTLQIHSLISSTPPSLSSYSCIPPSFSTINPPPFPSSQPTPHNPTLVLQLVYS